MSAKDLSSDEAKLLKDISKYAPGTVFGRKDTGSVDFFALGSFPRLLDKQLIQFAGEFEEGHPAYTVTPLGKIVAGLVSTGVQQFKAHLPPHNPPA